MIRKCTEKSILVLSRFGSNMTQINNFVKWRNSFARQCIETVYVRQTAIFKNLRSIFLVNNFKWLGLGTLTAEFDLSRFAINWQLDWRKAIHERVHWCNSTLRWTKHSRVSSVLMNNSTLFRLQLLHRRQWIIFQSTSIQRFIRSCFHSHELFLCY